MKQLSKREHTRYGFRLGALSAAFAIAMIATLVPAAGAKTVVTLQSPGVLLSHAVTVRTKVTVQCKVPKSTATLTVQLAQKQGKVVVHGTGSDSSTQGDFACDGLVHIAEVFVFTPTPRPPFDAGRASGTVTLKVCSTTCSTTTSARTIKIQ